MINLSVAIIGNGETTYNNAADLLADFAPDDNYVFYVPSYINSGGMKVVMQVLQDLEFNYHRVRKSELIETLMNSETKSKQLVILNSGGIENEISACLKAKIPVMDLTRGLYQLTELPLNGAESNAEATEEANPYTGMGQASQDVSEPQPVSMDIKQLWLRVDKLEREVKRLTAIASGETNWEPIPVQAGEFIGQKEQQALYDEAHKDGVPFWKSKRGKFRKAGNSKARPGETKVYLTEEEVAALD